MATKRRESGYVPCKCRDCFETAIADDMSKGAFCGDCEEAGCEEDEECQAEGAYGGFDDEASEEEST